MTDLELLEDAVKAAEIDDGAALRLAVKLGITIMFDCSSVWCEQYGVLENHNGDPCAATRRAIGRAAAEIGKYMP
jgi:hypothetical protein